jgi:hypothetical protein
MNDDLRSRREFFDSHTEIPEPRFSCPCCGYPMLFERGGFDICRICWWEDDGQDDPNADKVFGGPNHDYSLTDARKNFEAYLVMYPPDRDRRIGGADSEELRAIKRDLIEVFSQMLAKPSNEELNELWGKVKRLERNLSRDVKTKIKEFESKITERE